MEPKTLYITISLPALQPYQDYDPTTYLPILTDRFDPKTYETSLLSSPSSREEFSWGVYYLDEHRRGTWYFLNRLPSYRYSFDDHYDESGRRVRYREDKTPRHVLHTTKIQPAALLFEPNLISAHHVLTLPPSVQGLELPPYLTWLTRLTAPSTMRSFIWSTTIYIKTRTHILNVLDITDDSSEFDVNGFLKECLGIAYPELTHRLLGQGKAGVWGSDFSVEIVTDEEWVKEKEEEKSRERERRRGEFEKAWPRLTDVYNAGEG